MLLLARIIFQTAPNRGLYSTCWSTHKLPHTFSITRHSHLDASLDNVSGTVPIRIRLDWHYPITSAIRFCCGCLLACLPVAQVHTKSASEQRHYESVPPAPLRLRLDCPVLHCTSTTPPALTTVTTHVLVSCCFCSSRHYLYFLSNKLNLPCPAPLCPAARSFKSGPQNAHPVFFLESPPGCINP